MNKRLPIGISSFEEIRTGNYYYVDKTHFVYRLHSEGKYYFLSRPRRFGKSLFLDTIRCAFEARKELFENLNLEKNWNWNIYHPTVRLSFVSDTLNSEQLIQLITRQILKNSSYHNINLSANQNLPLMLEDLIISLYKQYNAQVILLIDEYDKPILDHIENTDIAMQNRKILKSLFSILKDLDKYLKFVFITGISKFAKVSLFSGLNQLRDISLSKDYSTICGYTHDELLSTFGHLINSQEELQLQKIQEWYNGYSWNGQKVYNPFDILLYLQERQFFPFWFETGTPSFLIRVLQQKQFYIPSMEKITAIEDLLNAFDIEQIEPEALLFQTGYLTILDSFVRNNRTFFHLSYPNYEVKVSLNSRIASLLTNSASLGQKLTLQLFDILDNNTLSVLPNFLNNLFAQVPFQWYTHTSQYEAFYCTIFYVFLVSTGLNVIAEDTSSTGSIDLTVLHQNIAYIFEFKVDKGNPIEQILCKQYYNKYLHMDKIIAIGIVVDYSSRSVKHFETKEIK